MLIGDAAHATTPHLASGAGLAVEDALVLCELLVGESAIEALKCDLELERADAAGLCPGCGAPYGHAVRFCAQCGTPLVPTEGGI